MQINPNQESVTRACVALAEAFGLDADAIMVAGRSLPTVPILGTDVSGYEVTVTIVTAQEVEPESEQLALSPELADLAARVDALFE